MEADAYKVLLNVITEKEKQPISECGICETETEGTACIQWQLSFMVPLELRGKKAPSQNSELVLSSLLEMIDYIDF